MKEELTEINLCVNKAIGMAMYSCYIVMMNCLDVVLICFYHKNYMNLLLFLRIH
jgi:hypothetical protein